MATTRRGDHDTMIALLYPCPAATCWHPIIVYPLEDQLIPIIAAATLALLAWALVAAVMIGGASLIEAAMNKRGRA
jgi:hypothetical protein